MYNVNVSLTGKQKLEIILFICFDESKQTLPWKLR